MKFYSHFFGFFSDKALYPHVKGSLFFNYMYINNFQLAVQHKTVNP